MQSVSYERKLGEYFFPEFLVSVVIAFQPEVLHRITFSYSHEIQWVNRTTNSPQSRIILAARGEYSFVISDFLVLPSAIIL
jgi:hypothetical protein